MEAEYAMIANLKKALECPVCFYTPNNGPLYQCENGHILCSGCIEKVQECPQCRTKLPATKIRCLLGEQQLEWLPKKCKYSHNGCDFEQMPSRRQVLHEHETECEHRFVECTVTACIEKVPLSKLWLHLKTAPHKAPREINGGLVDSKFTISSEILQESEEWTSWVSTHLTLNKEKEFYLECVRSLTGVFFLWVYMIGTPKEEEEFTYTITLFDINKAHYRTGKGNVISIDTPWKTICSVESAKPALIIPKALIKQFGGSLCDSNETFQLPYSLTIEATQKSTNNSMKRKSTED